MLGLKKMVVPKLNKELFSKVARQTKKQKKANRTIDKEAKG